jgi:non-canonical purine NTP pyrophosphatase (RdgB/HAM1 family)
VSAVRVNELLVATGNAGKAKEFREMLGNGSATGAGVVWRSLADYPKGDDVEETGKTFRANACLKASTYARRHNVWTLADDSGLEVDAIGGSPGVLSARWAQHNGTGKGDADNNATLLRQLEQVPDDGRTARFVCVLALSDPEGRIVLTARDTVEGRILRQPRGANGFGYDPLFLVDGTDRTSAEMSPDEKHAVSHRGKALRQLKELMIKLKLLGD